MAAHDSRHVIHTRPANGPAASIAPVDDPDVLAGLLEDAAHFPGGHAAGLIMATSEADVAAALRGDRRILPIGAQSSLTGGATPTGDLLLGTTRMNRILAVSGDRVRVEPGVNLLDLDRELAARHAYYPPAPTYLGAFAGGTVATNAAGAATFKYGTTRDWVEAITVVLPDGDVLDIERGATTAHPDGFFDIVGSRGTIRLEVPTYRMPAVPKLAAGYFATPGMDLIDLFIGSEGTLGVITGISLRIVSPRPAMCLAFVPFADATAALRFVEQLRNAAKETWRTKDPRGLDVSAIEHMDARSLRLVAEDGADRKNGVVAPADTAIAMLVTLELPAGTTAADAFDQIGAAIDGGAPDTPLVRFCRMLEAAGVMEHVEIAVPGDEARAAQLLAVREAVPAAVNQRVGRAKQAVDNRIEKTAADMIVPFDRFGELLASYHDEFSRRGLDYAVWGHISDGNVHPNVIPRSYGDVVAGKEAILALGRTAIALGGSPLAEHGVGRNPVKQRLLRELYGETGMEQMRAIKRALDPEGRIGRGVLFDI